MIASPAEESITHWSRFQNEMLHEDRWGEETSKSKGKSRHAGGGYPERREDGSLHGLHARL